MANSSKRKDDRINKEMRKKISVKIHNARTHGKNIIIIIIIITVTITKFSKLIGSVGAYLSRNWRTISWVSNCRYPI